MPFGSVAANIVALGGISARARTGSHTERKENSLEDLKCDAHGSDGAKSKRSNIARAAIFWPDMVKLWRRAAAHVLCTRRARGYFFETRFNNRGGRRDF